VGFFFGWNDRKRHDDEDVEIKRQFFL